MGHIVVARRRGWAGAAAVGLATAITLAGSPASAGGAAIAAATGGSDLSVTALAEPPASRPQGGAFDVTDTTSNIGDEPVGASTTRYHLVDHDTFSTSLNPPRSVDPLAAGASDPGTVTVTVPGNFPPGNYKLWACANDAPQLPDANSLNDCRISENKLTVVGAPNLQVTAVGTPPASRSQGTSFPASDTTINDGLAGAGASVTRYYLSLYPYRDDSDVALRTRPVPELAAGGSSLSGTVKTIIPLDTPVGTYYLIACADSAAGVAEAFENDNCATASGTIAVTEAQPELMVTVLGDLPERRVQGGSITVRDTTRNRGVVGAGKTETWYRLSIDEELSAGDRQLGVRKVPALAAGGTSEGSARFVIPMRTKPHRYHVIACADGGDVQTEVDETNNCRASRTKVAVVSAEQGR